MGNPADSYYLSHLPVILEASGLTASIAGGGATLDFTLDVIAFPLLIDGLKVVAIAGSVAFDFEVWEDAARTASGLRYRNLAAAVRIDDQFVRPLSYRPSKQNSTPGYGDLISAQTPFFCRITNNGVASTFYVEIRYFVQGGPLDNRLSGMTIRSPAMTQGV